MEGDPLDVLPGHVHGGVLALGVDQEAVVAVAHVLAVLEAELLVLLTDVPAVYADWPSASDPIAFCTAFSDRRRRRSRSPSAISGSPERCSTSTRKAVTPAASSDY